MGFPRRLWQGKNHIHREKDPVPEQLNGRKLVVGLSPSATRLTAGSERDDLNASTVLHPGDHVVTRENRLLIELNHDGFPPEADAFQQLTHRQRRVKFVGGAVQIDFHGC